MSENNDDLSLDAFDIFFEKYANSMSEIVAQSEFSALVRQNELKLLGGTFQVETMEDDSQAALQASVDDSEASI